MLALFLALIAAPGATVTGTVSASTIPAPVPASLTHDRHVCGQGGQVWTATVSADGNGRITGAIVYLEPRGPTDIKSLMSARKEPALVIDQKNCEFVPRAAAVKIGTEVRVRSSDAVFHNVHVKALDGSTVANVSIPLAGTEAPAFTTKKRGPLFLTCDAGHHWMKAEILVLDHGYHVETRRAGAYRLENVPPGAWWLIAWHPRLGETKVELDVRASDRTLSVPLGYK